MSYLDKSALDEEKGVAGSAAPAKAAPKAAPKVGPCWDLTTIIPHD